MARSIVAELNPLSSQLHPAIDYNPLEELEGLPHKGTGGEAVLGIALLKQILSSEAEKRASEFGKEV